MQVTIHSAKTHLSRLIKQACEGEEVVISRGNQPVVRLVPIHPQGRRIFGAMRGQATVGDAFLSHCLMMNLKAGTSNARIAGYACYYSIAPQNG